MKKALVSGKKSSKRKGVISLRGNPKKKIKICAYVLAGIFVIELLFGAVLLCKLTDIPSSRSCVLRYVLNPNIRENLHTCGQVPKTEACALYIMNHTRYNKRVGDFIKEASHLTNTPMHQIMVNNSNYIHQQIVPGYFAQIKIPPVQ